MTPLSFDFETACIRPGLLAPPAVCVTWKRPGVRESISHWAGEEPHLRDWLEDPNLILVGANVAYDMGVICANYPRLLPLVFKAYEENRVTDIQIRQKLLDIAGGCYRGRMVLEGTDWKFESIKYSLFDCTRRLSGRLLKKDGFRMFYGFFRDVPLCDWVDRATYLQSPRGQEEIAKELIPDQIKELKGMLAADPREVLTYPLEDAVATEECYLKQQEQDPTGEFLVDEYNQTRAYWWLHLMSAWGVHTDPTAVMQLREQTERQYQQVYQSLVASGLVKKNGSKDTKAAKALMERVCLEKSLPLRKTKTGEVSLDSDACEVTEDIALEDYGEYSTLSKVMSNDLKMLQEGVHRPIQSRFDLAETGRTTSSKPNIQNLRRMPGIRECFRPRKGKVFVQADYDQLELRTLGQVCVSLLKQSRLAQMLNEGQDPHAAVAANILGLAYEEVIKNKKRPDVDRARQTGKVANFGFPGGLGAARLCHFAKKSYNVELSEAKAKELKEIWLRTFPEMRAYFNMVEGLPADKEDNRWLIQLFSKRIRGGASYTAACNSYFQGLGSDATKAAGWLICKACYADPQSPMFGSRIVMYIHDEFVVECDEAKAHDVGKELVRLMTDGIKDKWLPDVPPTTEAVCMRYYSKEAYPRHDVSGTLIPWAGEHKCSKCKHEYIPPGGPGSEQRCPSCGHVEEK